MFRIPLNICFVILIIAFFTSCGEDVNDVLLDCNGGGKSDCREISRILHEHWKKGYENKDLGIYESAFWPEVHHTSDNGTPDDPNDDLIIESRVEEIDFADNVFKRFTSIKMVISEPIDIKIDGKLAYVKNNYMIQFLAEASDKEKAQYIGYYAEGRNIFTFMKKSTPEGETWRILKWQDEATPPDEIIGSVY